MVGCTVGRLSKSAGDVWVPQMTPFVLSLSSTIVATVVVDLASVCVASSRTSAGLCSKRSELHNEKVNVTSLAVIGSCPLLGPAKVKQRRRGDKRHRKMLGLLKGDRRKKNSPTTFAGYGTTFFHQ